MNLAVMNFSGNVGKSTIARHLLAPRLNNARIIPVESINSDGTEDDAIKGKQFGALLDALAVSPEDDAVIDVGASNVEDFVALMRQYRESHEDFDYFVVPTVSRPKQLRDTISTIAALSEIGVDAFRIRVVMNMVEQDDDPESVFSSIYAYHARDNAFTLRPNAVIRTNEIYSRIKGDMTIAGVLKDDTDYKALIRKTQDSGERLRLAQMNAVRRLAAGVTIDLDAVFETLLG